VGCGGVGVGCVVAPAAGCREARCAVFSCAARGGRWSARRGGQERWRTRHAPLSSTTEAADNVVACVCFCLLFAIATSFGVTRRHPRHKASTSPTERRYRYTPLSFARRLRATTVEAGLLQPARVQGREGEAGAQNCGGRCSREAPRYGLRCHRRSELFVQRSCATQFSAIVLLNTKLCEGCVEVVVT